MYVIGEMNTSESPRGYKRNSTPIPQIQNPRFLPSAPLRRRKHAHTVSSHDDPLEEKQEEARPRQRRARPYRKAPQASRRPRKRRRNAPPPHTLRQISPGIFRESRHALFPQAPQQVPLPHRQHRQALVDDPQEVKDKASKDNVPLVDVTQFGYFKVLGKGVLPENKPVVVKAKLVSKIAEKKIKEAGGAVVLTA
ncbi:hypothetical protein DH2020_003637 [Rehmannia glutinosa]|uniref:Large ribosomal subunit protein uL15/eL18 domain-containing protein n=1 Tax=Rehmannia glutinosa TaxID=99300 RepID=A0ABR0XM95_REHGL